MNLSTLYSKSIIQSAVSKLGEKISNDYSDTHTQLVLIPVLKGAWIFSADLARNITIPVTTEFIRTASYSGKTNNGKIDLLLDVDKSKIINKNILLVDTVLDTGNTINFLLNHTRSMGAASVELCILINKVQKRKHDISVKYCGIEGPNSFLVGYGLDIDDKYRNLDEISVVI
jgi:hypoxanthine phosphoribosyltransferase